MRYKGERFYPENIPKNINVRSDFDAGKDIELGVPIRPGDTIEIRSTLHEVYEKTGRSGSMYFVVIRFTMTNQRGEMLAIVDNRFMHRQPDGRPSFDVSEGTQLVADASIDRRGRRRLSCGGGRAERAELGQQLVPAAAHRRGEILVLVRVLKKVERLRLRPVGREYPLILRREGGDEEIPGVFLRIERPGRQRAPMPQWEEARPLRRGVGRQTEDVEHRRQDVDQTYDVTDTPPGGHGAGLLARFGGRAGGVVQCVAVRPGAVRPNCSPWLVRMRASSR